MSTEYTVEVSGQIGNVTPIQNKDSFKLTLRNPCIDQAYISIETASLQYRPYDLYDFPPLGLQWNHQAFQIKTLPIEHSLCGGLTYKATLNNVAVDSSTTPLTYQQENRAFSYYSEDQRTIHSGFW